MGLKDLFTRQSDNSEGIIADLFSGSRFMQNNRSLEEFSLSLLTVEANDCLLEVGFGNGFMIGKMAPLLSGGCIYGIDYSDGMVQEATKRNQKHIEKGIVTLQQGNLSHLPFEANFFNKVVSNNTIYFWQNPLQEAGELLRVLKPGGLLAIGFRTKEQLCDLNIDQIEDIFQHYNPDELEELLRTAGFETIGLEHKQETQGAHDSFVFLSRKSKSNTAE